MALGIVDAQIKRVAVRVIIAVQGARVKSFKGLQLAVTRQAAHHRQNARMEGAYHLAGVLEGERASPKGKNLQQFVDEVFARFTGEGHNRH